LQKQSRGYKAVGAKFGEGGESGVQMELPTGVTFLHFMPVVLEACPVMVFISSGKTEISQQQRQSQQEKTIKVGLSVVEILTGIGTG